MPAEPISQRALNRATLDRQHLLRRVRKPVVGMVEHLVGLQAQTPHTAYVGLWDRIEDFTPDALADRIVDRSVVRMALMRGTIHLVSAADAWGLRPLMQPVLDRVQRSNFDKRLGGIDRDALVADGRAFVTKQPRTFKELGDHLLGRWPSGDRLAMEQTIRTEVPLVQVPPRGLWGRSGPIEHTSIEAWLGAPPPSLPAIDDIVRRYLAAFGPASAMDVQAWCGLTRIGEVIDRLRPDLIEFRAEDARALFDVQDAPRPGPDITAAPRYLYDYENILLSYADRSRFIQPGLARSLTERTQGSLSTVMLDGVVAGTWVVRRERSTATLVVTPYRPLTAAERRGLEDEGAGLLAFVAAEAGDRVIRFDPVRVP
jgi:winged helix DNA-binding protein